MKVAELYAALRLHVDAASFKKGDDKLKQLGERIAKFGKAANKAFGRGLNAAAVGLTGVIVAGAKDALDFDKALTALYLSSNRTMGTQQEMRQSFLDMSQATGVAKEQLIAAAQAYVALTGDGAGATEAVKTFARVATASNSSIDDVASAAAALREQFGILPNQMEQAFSILVAGGKAGKIELKDMAALTASLAAGFKSFGGSQGLGGTATLGALFQVAAKDAGSASAAAVNLENLFAKIKSRKGELADIGVKVENGKVGSNQYKDIITIIELLGKAKDKDFAKFNDAFGNDMQATNALEALRGRLGLVRELVASTQNQKVIAEDLGVVEQSAAFKAAKAWNEVKLALARAFTPERIEQIARLLTRISDAIVTIIDKIGGVENAVWMMVGAWTALKALQLSGALFQITTQLTAMAAAGGLASSRVLGLGAALGKVGTGVAAFAGGYGIGTAVDQGVGAATGRSLSDRLAGIGDEFGLQQAAYKGVGRARQAAGGGNVNVQATINVDGSKNPEHTGREVKRQIEGALRDSAAALAGGM